MTTNRHSGIKKLSSNSRRSRTIQKCEICGTKESPQTRMWHFPKNEDRCRQWLKCVGNEDLVYIPIEKLHILKQVCVDHFLPEDYSDNTNELKESAIPMIQLTKEPLSDDIFAEFPFHLANSDTTQNNGGDTTIEENIKPYNGKSKTSNTIQPNQSYNSNLQDDLAKNWSSILCQGLPAGVKTKILNKYKIPSNCELLAAPSFNPRIIQILPKSTKIRDDVMRNNQQQLSLGIAALGRVLSNFSSENNQDDSETKQILSDACQILTDLHCMISQHRLSMLTGDESFTIANNGTGTEVQ